MYIKNLLFFFGATICRLLILSSNVLRKYYKIRKVVTQEEKKSIAEGTN